MRNSLIFLNFTDGNYKVAAVLLENKAKVDAQDKKGWTPIHYATYKGNLHILG